MSTAFPRSSRRRLERGLAPQLPRQVHRLHRDLSRFFPFDSSGHAGCARARLSRERTVPIDSSRASAMLWQLAEWFGRWGEDLLAKARGLSESAVSNERERKSVGEQETFEVDSLDATFVLERTRALACTVTLREFHHLRAREGPEAWTSEEALCGAALELLLPFLDDRENPRRRKIRLIGVRAEKLLR